MSKLLNIGTYTNNNPYNIKNVKKNKYNYDRGMVTLQCDAR